MVDRIARDLPENSSIVIAEVGGAITISIPHKDHTYFTRKFAIVFLIVFSAGWGLGTSAALQKILYEDAPKMLWIWFCLWLLGGPMVLYLMYVTADPNLPEQITFKDERLFLDSGVPPTRVLWRIVGFRKLQMWLDESPWSRAEVEFDRSDLKTLELQKDEKRSRLTVRRGTALIEIGAFVSEAERTWLHKVLDIFFRTGRVEFILLAPK